MQRYHYRGCPHHPEDAQISCHWYTRRLEGMEPVMLAGIV